MMSYDKFQALTKTWKKAQRKYNRAWTAHNDAVQDARKAKRGTFTPITSTGGFGAYSDDDTDNNGFDFVPDCPIVDQALAALVDAKAVAQKATAVMLADKDLANLNYDFRQLDADSSVAQVDQAIWGVNYCPHDYLINDTK